MYRRVTRFIGIFTVFSGCLASSSQGATADLRIGTYNLEADIDGVTTPRTGLYTALEAIGSTTVAGNAQPLDILGMEETTSNTTTVQPIVTNLNSYYSGIGANVVYSLTGLQGTESGNDAGSGNGPNSLIYNTKTLTLLQAVGIGTPTGSGNGEYRQITRYEFKPIAGTTGDAFYIYVDHYKSGSGSTDNTDRQKEAQIVLTDEATLPTNANVIYSGDLNDNPNANTDYSVLTTSTGAGKAYDPLNGAEGESALTDSSTKFNYRDDYELVTQPLLTGANGISLITASYTTFGNNGTQTSADRSDLQTASDHVPVFADYSYTLVPEPVCLSAIGLCGLFLSKRRVRVRT